MSYAGGGAVEIATHIFNLALAYVLALLVGWDREREDRTAGVRTFPLVAIASCGFVLVGIAVLGREAQAQARIMEGLITGVGFIGGGAILKHGTKATGTATAASLWATGALGAAVGYGLYDIAIALSLTTFLTLRCAQPMKKAANERAEPRGAS